jgi:hypothetical protein
MNLHVSTPAIEGLYEAAKWLKLPVLADASELAFLFKRLGEIELYLLGTPSSKSELCLSQDFFLSAVQSWTDKLQRGESPTMADLRSTLACAMTSQSDCLWLQELQGERYLAKIRQPVVQIQAHFFTFAQEEKTFHSMVFGKESIFWGVQFSFPQIFMDPQSGEFKKVDSSFVNSALFQEIRRWSRDETRATPFLIGDEQINVPIRLGKNCFSWIAKHPQLAVHNLGVAHAH